HGWREYAGRRGSAHPHEGFAANCATRNRAARAEWIWRSAVLHLEPQVPGPREHRQGGIAFRFAASRRGSLPGEFGAVNDTRVRIAEIGHVSDPGAQRSVEDI